MNQVTLFRDNQTGLDFAADLGEVTPVSWQPPAELTFEEWTAIGNTLQQVGASLNWWIGDWLNYGERKWGEMYAQAIEVTGWNYETLRTAKWVAGNVNLSIRIDKLSWTHHRYVADLPPDEQADWLNRALTDGWRSKQLRDAIKASKQLSPILPLPELPHTNGNGYHDNDLDDLPFTTLPQMQEEADEISDIPPAVVEYIQHAHVRECPDCHQVWAADLPYCPYCNVTPQARIAYVQQERTLHLSAANHAVSDDPNYDGDEWYTPAEYIDAARRVMGGIDLDPASCDEAQEVVKAAYYYTKQDDGLTMPWFGCVWLNPPYSTPLIRQFVTKLIEEHAAGNITEAVILTNNSSDTAWFHDLLARYPACFTRGRVQFWRADHETFGARQGQTLFYLGENITAFRDTFARFGQVVTRL